MYNNAHVRRCACARASVRSDSVRPIRWTHVDSVYIQRIWKWARRFNHPIRNAYRYRPPTLADTRGELSDFVYFGFWTQTPVFLLWPFSLVSLAVATSAIARRTSSTIRNSNCGVGEKPHLLTCLIALDSWMDGVEVRRQSSWTRNRHYFYSSFNAMFSFRTQVASATFVWHAFICSTRYQASSMAAPEERWGGVVLITKSTVVVLHLLIIACFQNWLPSPARAICHYPLSYCLTNASIRIRTEWTVSRVGIDWIRNRPLFLFLSIGFCLQNRLPYPVGIFNRSESVLLSAQYCISEFDWRVGFCRSLALGNWIRSRKCQATVSLRLIALIGCLILIYCLDELHQSVRLTVAVQFRSSLVYQQKDHVKRALVY